MSSAVTDACAALVPSLDLVRRTIAAEDAYTLSRLRVLERIPGNPIGIAYRALDEGLIAMMARHLASPSFNSVRGSRAGHERHIAPLVAWYRENGIKARFELAPGFFCADLAASCTAWATVRPNSIRP